MRGSVHERKGVAGAESNVNFLKISGKTWAISPKDDERLQERAWDNPRGALRGKVHDFLVAYIFLEKCILLGRMG